MAAGDFLVYKFPVWTWYASFTVALGKLSTDMALIIDQGKRGYDEGKRFPASRQTVPRNSRGALSAPCYISRLHGRG